MRDKGECRYGKKCRYSHEPIQVKRARDQKLSLNVFSIDMATDESDLTIMVANRGNRAGANLDLDPINTVQIDTDDALDDKQDGDFWIEDRPLLKRETEVKRAPSIKMMATAKRTKSSHQP